MNALVIIMAFFFSLLMCLGLILTKWIIAQLGTTLFFLVMFLALSIFVLAVGDEVHDDE